MDQARGGGAYRYKRQLSFLAYGTDWLAFAHLVIAIVFIGPYLDPVRNKWVVTFGLIACASILPLALIAGHMREIPLPWSLIDCSFGVFGAIPLLLCWRSISVLEKQRLRRYCVFHVALPRFDALEVEDHALLDKIRLRMTPNQLRITEWLGQEVPTLHPAYVQAVQLMLGSDFPAGSMNL